MLNKEKYKIEPIATDRFILRKVEMSDVENIFSILSDAEVIKNLNMPLHSDMSITRDLLLDYEDEYVKGFKYPYAIIDKENNRFLGVFLIKLDIYDDDCYEFTIYINKDSWGMGIYSEVLPYMVDIAFNKIKTRNFRGFVKESCIASHKVLKKYGFVLEKIFKVPNIDEQIYSWLMKMENYYKKV